MLNSSVNFSFLCQHTPMSKASFIVQPLFSQCSPGDKLWITKSKGVGLIVCAISSKISNLCDHNPPCYRQTDGQTNGWHAIARPHFAL